MKKNFMLLLALTLLLPNMVIAKVEDYQSMGLKEACDKENIPFNHEGYIESEEKANIYLFRGSGCEHCYDFLTYLEAITEQYGDHFNLISFEVWGNENNHKLMEKVASKRKEDLGGVPYIIIGNKSWSGYSDSLNMEIFSAIMEEYENKNANDMVDKIINQEDKFGLTDVLVIVGAVITFGLIIYGRSKTKEEAN